LERILLVTHTRVLEEDLAKLNSIRDQCGFRGVAWVVHSLLEQQAANVATIEAIMNERVPVVLTGKPLSGKSYFVKNKLLPSLSGSPVLLIDSLSEYTDVKTIGFDIFGINFGKCNEHLRFIPNSQSRVAETEVEALFSNLDMKRNNLADWSIIVEEAQAYANVASFTKFLYSSRHYLRKMVVVSPKTDAFLGLVTLTILR
jgi:hypothetical protein